MSPKRLAQIGTKVQEDRSSNWAELKEGKHDKKDSGTTAGVTPRQTARHQH